MAKKIVKKTKKKETSLPIEIPVSRLIDAPYVTALMKNTALRALLEDLIEAKARQLQDTKKAWEHFEKLTKESVPEFDNITHVMELKQDDPPILRVSKR
jgi:hypothetical protein